jgi:hypothetical protein
MPPPDPYTSPLPHGQAGKDSRRIPLPAQKRLRLTLDLTRHRLDFAEIGAAEVVKGAVAPPTPGTDAWWQAAVREAVYTLRERGLAQYVRGAEVVNWTGPSC